MQKLLVMGHWFALIRKRITSQPVPEEDPPSIRPSKQLNVIPCFIYFLTFSFDNFRVYEAEREAPLNTCKVLLRISPVCFQTLPLLRLLLRNSKGSKDTDNTHGCELDVDLDSALHFWLSDISF